MCIEAVGFASCMMDCANAAAHRAAVVEVGIPSKPMEFPFDLVQKKELDLRGSRNALRADLDVYKRQAHGRVRFNTIFEIMR